MTAPKFIVGIGAALVLASAPGFAQNAQQGQPSRPAGGSQQQQQEQLQRQQQQRQADRAMTQDRTMDHQRMQTRERDEAQQQTRTTEQTKAKAATGVYGGNLMTAEERSRYRAQLQAMKTEQERTEFEARHREQMQVRGREKGVEPVVTED